MIDMILFHKDQIHSTDNEEKGEDVIPVKMVVLEEDVSNDGKHSQWNTFLDHFQLYQTEWSAIAFKSHTVGRNLTAILQKGNSPWKNDNTDKRPVAGNTRLL